MDGMWFENFVDKIKFGSSDLLIVGENEFGRGRFYQRLAAALSGVYRYGQDYLREEIPLAALVEAGNFEVFAAIIIETGGKRMPGSIQNEVCQFLEQTNLARSKKQRRATKGGRFDVCYIFWAVENATYIAIALRPKMIMPQDLKTSSAKNRWTFV